jgi:hypothetical protein
MHRDLLPVFSPAPDIRPGAPAGINVNGKNFGSPAWPAVGVGRASAAGRGPASVRIVTKLLRKFRIIAQRVRFRRLALITDEDPVCLLFRSSGQLRGYERRSGGSPFMEIGQ